MCSSQTAKLHPSKRIVGEEHQQRRKAGARDVRGVEITHGFIPRTTFVIDKNQKIVAVFSSETDHIAPDEHVKKSLAIVKGL